MALLIDFESGRGPIEVAVDCHGAGQAYFRRDDMLAPIRDWEFTHPARNTHYRVLIDTRPGRNCTLQVCEWRNVSTAKIAVVTAQPSLTPVE